MNHLAHLFLADDDAESLIGNLAADFLKGPIPHDLASGVQRGIALHRKVDAFTDSHETVMRSRQRLFERWHHHARIIVDVAYDHFLSREWSRYHSVPLPRFIDATYVTLLRAVDLAPPELRRPLPRMIENDWLSRCGDIEGVRNALRFISRRMRRDIGLEDAADDVERMRDELSGDFATFFPQLIRAVEKWNAPDQTIHGTSTAERDTGLSPVSDGDSASST
ncbi:MAG: ACP phosphodiesterase [Thermoanaerobaculia bacterium]